MKHVLLTTGIVLVIGLSLARGDDADRSSDRSGAFVAQTGTSAATDQPSDNEASAEYALLGDVDALSSIPPSPGRKMPSTSSLRM